VQIPEETKVRIFPLTVHTPAVLVDRVTVRPLVEVASKTKGNCKLERLFGGENVIACATAAALKIKLLLAELATRNPVLAALVAVTTQVVATDALSDAVEMEHPVPVVA
jgi:hypothetical protein